MPVQDQRIGFTCSKETVESLHKFAEHHNCSQAEAFRQLVQAGDIDDSMGFDLAKYIRPVYYDLICDVARQNEWDLVEALEHAIAFYQMRPDVLKHYEEHPASRDLTKHEPAPSKELVRVYIETWAVDRLRHRAKLLGWSLGKYLAVFVQVCILQYKKDKVERSGYRPELTE